VAQRAVIVGVHVSCCKPSSFTIKFTCQSSQAIALIVIAVFLSLLIVFMLWKRRSRIAALARSVASRSKRDVVVLLPRKRAAHFIDATPGATTTIARRAQ
jgi:predicted PurR-regulated permease PerM